MHEDFKTEQWRNELNTLLKIDELEKALREFSDIDFSGKNVDEIDKAYFSRIGLYPGVTKTITPSEVNILNVYRVRNNIDPRKENIGLSSTFGYPPSSICKWNGRANIEMNPVFYCSDDIKTSFREVRPESNQLAFVSYWKIECDRNVNFFPMLPNNLSEANPWKSFSDDIYKDMKKFNQQIGGDKAEELTLLHNVFSDWFTSEEEPYSKTSWISNKYLYNTNGIDFLLYPSFVNSQNTCCIAIHPNFVDNFMRLDKVISCRFIELKQGKLELSIAEIGKPSLTNLNWTKPTLDEIEVFKNDLGIR